MLLIPPCKHKGFRGGEKILLVVVYFLLLEKSGIILLNMSEFSAKQAYMMPTTFSDDTVTPFWDLGMGNWSCDERKEFFAGKRVLDIGSGQEGLARGLFALFVDEPVYEKPWVINLNPQFRDWRMVDTREGSRKKYKQDSIKEGIRLTMEMAHEDIEGYFASRIAVAGLVQELNFPDEQFDVVTSGWAFPRGFYDCHFSQKDHEAGYAESLRVLRPGGAGLFGPIIAGAQQKHTANRLEAVRGWSDYQFKPASDGDVLELIKAA